ncbi:MAG: NUDIX hydrolase [Vulcanimicrobiaceae bacterium]
MNVLDSKQIWQGRIINLRVDEIEGVRGGKHRTIEVVEHPGGVAVIARPSRREIVLVRQYRHPVGEELWEVPAGKIERGEPPIETAQRELLEETGYSAERLRFLWSMYSTPGFCSERIHFFVAVGLKVGEAKPEADEQFEIRSWSIEDAWRLVERDELRDSKTQIALSWARSQR